MNIDPFSVPLARPLETADSDPQRTRDGFFLTVEVGGERGLGEATPLAGWTESLTDCRTALEAIDDPQAALEAGAGVLDDRPAARHGVVLAVADARARAAGDPLYRHLGGPDRVGSVPVNATVGDCSRAETARAVETAVAAGFPAVKVKVGARTVAADIERVRTAREVADENAGGQLGEAQRDGAQRDGGPVELRADANGAWTLEQAREAFEALADIGVSYVEQPVPAADLADAATLRAEFGPTGGRAGRGTDGRHSVGVALDEAVATRGVGAVLDAEAADVVVCKPMVLGGPDRARDTAVRAREAGLDAAVTTTVDAAVARAAGAHVAASIPNVRACGLATGSRLAADLPIDAFRADGGRIRIPRGSGNLGRPSGPEGDSRGERG